MLQSNQNNARSRQQITEPATSALGQDSIISSVKQLDQVALPKSKSHGKLVEGKIKHTESKNPKPRQENQHNLPLSQNQVPEQIVILQKSNRDEKRDEPQQYLLGNAWPADWYTGNSVQKQKSVNFYENVTHPTTSSLELADYHQRVQVSSGSQQIIPIAGDCQLRGDVN